VEVACLLLAGAIGDQLRGAGVTVHSLGMARGRPDPRGIARLAAVFRAMRPDVVHSHMVHANLMARAARLVASVPLLVCSAHSIDEEGWWREVGYRLTDPLCDVTTNVSRAATERYRRLRLAAPSRLECVPNGIVVERYAAVPDLRHQTRVSLGVADGDMVWLAVGRMDPPKDPVTLVRAFAKHAAHDVHARLILAGSGTLEGATRDAIAELHMHDRARMLGARDDIPALLGAADAFVLSSRWEGLPMVVLEAGAARLPIVATAVPGTVELVQDGVTGVLAEPGDVESLAAALARVAAMTEDQWGKMGRAAAAQAQAAYDMDQVLDRWEELYDRRLAARGRSLPAREATPA
jgi:glycosyltransferase involved in cell wall biosynthesis